MPTNDCFDRFLLPYLVGWMEHRVIQSMLQKQQQKLIGIEIFQSISSNFTCNIFQFGHEIFVEQRMQMFRKEVFQCGRNSIHGYIKHFDVSIWI